MNICSHSLVIHHPPFDVDHKKAISEITGLNCLFEDVAVLWESRESVMRAYSKTHPYQVFELAIMDEEEDNIAIEYYKNGKRQYTTVRMEYDPFIESSLS